MNTAKVYHDSDGNPLTIHQMVRDEPQWAANRIQVGEEALARLEAAKAAALKHVEWDCEACRAVLSVLDSGGAR